MLRIIYGLAGTGKTAEITKEISELVQKGTGGIILLVPEQYSHEAERELCRKCGPKLSRYAEVLSFTGLARKIAGQVGGLADEYIDEGGKMLSLALAVSAAAAELKVFRAAAYRQDLQITLLHEINAMKEAGVSVENLCAAAEQIGGETGEKLRELAIIRENCDAIISTSRVDPADRLSVLAERLEDSAFDENSRIYVDGFTDFTAVELNVLSALMKKGVQLTVCLTTDKIYSENEIFAIPSSCAGRLIKLAQESGTEHTENEIQEKTCRSPGITAYAESLFNYKTEKELQNSGVEVHKFRIPSEECEYAAARALELLRQGARWRDIAVAVRGFEDYRAPLESAFENYGVPLYVAARSEVLSKPLAAFIDYSFSIIIDGFEAEDILSWLGTGLSGLSLEECDLLGSYVYRWQLRESSWKKAEDWKRSPEGYGKLNEADAAKLAEINSLRRVISAPLFSFEKKCADAETAGEKVKVLVEFLTDMKIPEKLGERADSLARAGLEKEGRESEQLWDVLMDALTQIYNIAGELRVSTGEFADMLSVMLTGYKVGTIPVSLDKVSAGDFDRMRRRNVKHLIVLGADASRVPAKTERKSVFSDAELTSFTDTPVDALRPDENELWREYLLIYNTVSLPSDTLDVCFSLTGFDGGENTPSVLVTKLCSNIKNLPAENMAALRLAAPGPALTVGASGREIPEAEAAEKYFMNASPEKLEKLKKAAAFRRGMLSKDGAADAFGQELRVSPSKADDFFSCRLKYFWNYGLGAKKYEPFTFAPRDFGTFTHSVLENTARDVMDRGGFKTVEESEISVIADGYIRQFVEEELSKITEQKERSEYIFNIISEEVKLVVMDVAAELRKSDFKPLAYELNFGDGKVFPPMKIGEGDSELTIIGIADRVDGWENNGQYYIRIADYKTGKKDMKIKDLWNGKNLQMFMYLHAVKNSGDAGAEALHIPRGAEIVPAGAEYIPASSRYASEKPNTDPDVIAEEYREKHRRKGIVLNDENVIEAWENDDKNPKIYIPAGGRKDKEGNKKPRSYSEDKLLMLDALMENRLREMAKALKSGDVGANPSRTSDSDNSCQYCDFAGSCGFFDGENGEHYHVPEKMDEKTFFAKPPVPGETGGEEENYE